MKIINPFKMANWELNRFTLTVLLIQISIFILTGLDQIGIQIPLLRQLVAIIYLTFIPGIIIIRILKLRNLGTVESLLYAIGLSIASLMFIGLLVNALYSVGINNPISLTPLLISISIFIFILLIISLIRDDGFKKYDYLNKEDIISPWPLFLFSIPFFVIIGTYLVNFYNVVAFIMLMVILISSIPILITFNRIPKKLYPLTIFVVAISLLYHTALISKFIWGYDVILEYHYADIVLKNSFWDPKLISSYNGVLSIVMLLPIYSIISNLSLDTIIKVIYPFIYSFVPLGLFLLFKKQTESYKLSFLSVFLFMALMSFFMEKVSLARQEIAELFLVLLFIVLFSKDIKYKWILYIIFGVSLMVSHYSIIFMYTFLFFGVWLSLVILRSRKIKNLINRIFIKSSIPRSNNFLDVTMVYNINKDVNREDQGYMQRFGYFLKEILFNYEKNTKIGIFLVIFLLVTSVLWYNFYVSSSHTFINLTALFKSILLNITDLLNPESSQGLNEIVKAYSSPARMVMKYLYLITQFLTVIGFLSVVFFRRYKYKFEDSFIAFSFFNLIILFASVVLPNLAGSFNASRFFSVALIFLAPFFIIGSAVTLKFVVNKIKPLKYKYSEFSLKPLGVFLTIFLLFNSGVATELAGDYSTSMVFDKKDWVFFFKHDQDTASSQWLAKNRSGRVYGDYFSSISFMNYGYILTDNSDGSINDTTNDTETIYEWTTIDPNSYIIMRYGDIKTIKTRYNNPYYKVLSLNLTVKMDKIYDSDSQIYWSSKPVSF